ncbi:MAG: hypothetical protein AB7E52_06385 [Bdellovibrionales bacterium]
MGSKPYSKSFASGDASPAYELVYDHLMSLDRPDLSEVIDAVKVEGGWPSSFCCGLEGLQAYREYYDQARLMQMSAEQKQTVQLYDEEWTLTLLDRMNHIHVGLPDEEV